MDTNLISRDELKARIDRGHRFTLIMALGEWQFRAKHIPGSVNISSPDDPRLGQIDKHADIVVYCADVDCPASAYAQQGLQQRGFPNVRRYAGGVADWESAGLPLEGDWRGERTA